MISFNGKNLCESCLNEISGEVCDFCGYDKSTAREEVGVLAAGSILLGKYIVGRTIGKGGFGVTYLAYDTKLEKKVAIKEYYPGALAARGNDGCTVVMTNSEEATLFKNGIEKFYEEASLVSRFNGNPSIVSVYEFFYENETAYFSMELLDGCTLKSYISKKGVLSPEEALFIADSVSTALMITHSVNVLHRDISPDNIMICRNGTVKLIDFGAARQVLADNPKSMSVILKQGFAPLEQYQKRGKQGPWTDLYSLGATLYYALTQDCIDDPMTRMDSDEEFLSNKYGIEEQLWEIIVHATQLRIPDRYSDAFEFRNALNKVNYAPKPLVVPEEENHLVHQPAVKTVSEKPETVRSSEIPETIVEKSAEIPMTVMETAVTAQEQAKPHRNGKIIAGISAAAVVVLGAVIAGVAMLSSGGNEIETAGDAYVTRAAETTVKVTTTTTKEPKKTTTTTEPVTEKTTTTTTEPVTEKTTTTTTAPATEKTTTTTTEPVTEKTTTTTVTSPKETKAETGAEVVIAGVSYPSDTTYIELSDKGLKDSDIKNITKLKKLTIVIINNNSITDLSPFSELSELEGIWINNNKITSLSPLKGLKNLKYISVEDNDIDSLSPLNGTTKLEQLWCGGNPISDISPISNNKGLEQLGLRDCNISSISALSGMKELKVLAINGNSISDISPLKNTKKLEEFWCSDNPITDISPIKNNTGMKEISFSYCDIGSLSAISGMKNLETLYASYCGLTSISEIKNLKNLSYIEIGYNYLDNVSALTGCTEITELYISGNCCSDKETFLNSLSGVTLAQGGTIWIEDQNFEWESESECTDYLNELLYVNGTGEYYYAS